MLGSESATVSETGLFNWRPDGIGIWPLFMNSCMMLQAVAEAAIGSKSAREMSSLSLPVVRVLGQSYFFSLGVKAMAVTSTHKGITSKNVLLGTNTDQVRTKCRGGPAHSHDSNASSTPWSWARG